jgi:hypothetical protein
MDKERNSPLGASLPVPPFLLSVILFYFIFIFSPLSLITKSPYPQWRGSASSLQISGHVESLSSWLFDDLGTEDTVEPQTPNSRGCKATPALLLPHS